MTNLIFPVTSSALFSVENMQFVDLSDFAFESLMCYTYYLIEIKNTKNVFLDNISIKKS